MKRELHLNLFINSRGHHEASWRHPDASELDLTDVQYLQGLSQRAEEGLFDSIFLADQLSFRGGGAALSLEPLTALAALAGLCLAGISATTAWHPPRRAEPTRSSKSSTHVSQMPNALAASAEKWSKAQRLLGRRPPHLRRHPADLLVPLPRRAHRG